MAANPFMQKQRPSWTTICLLAEELASRQIALVHGGAVIPEQDGTHCYFQTVSRSSSLGCYAVVSYSCSRHAIVSSSICEGQTVRI